MKSQLIRFKTFPFEQRVVHTLKCEHIDCDITRVCAMRELFSYNLLPLAA